MHRANFQKWLLGILLCLLPLHGFLSVLLPAGGKFYKEGLLLGLFLFGLPELIQGLKTKRNFQVVALLGLYGLLLVFFHSKTETAFIALRYLLLGYGAFLLFDSKTFQTPENKKWLQKSFFLGVFLSLLLGFWAEYGNGLEWLKDFYSPTISSWVPGQKIPLYHEANGIMRMQGGSSGPIEFSHLLLGALFLILTPLWNKSWWKKIFITLLLLSIYLSYSRAALLGTLFLGLWYGRFIFQKTLSPILSLKKGRLLLALYALKISLITALLLLIFKPNFLDFSRGGTLDHFTRPLQAMEDFQAHPLFGNLGSYGPAARIYNFKTIQNDQAPLAENVWLDALVQMGIIGIFLILSFWFLAFKSSSINGRFWIIFVLMLGNFATLFDMTPLSLIWFWILSQESISSQK